MENQRTPLRRWFLHASQTHIEPQPPPAKPLRGPPIGQASLALGRRPLVAATITPLQTEPAQNQTPSSLLKTEPAQNQTPSSLPPPLPPPPNTQIPRPAPATKLARPSMVSSPTVSPPPTTTLQPQTPQTPVPQAQKPQQSGQRNTSTSSLDTPKPLLSSSQPSSPAPPRTILTNKAPTPPQSPAVIRSSLPTPPRLPHDYQASNHMRPNSEPEDKRLSATPLKSIVLWDNSENNGMKYDNNGKQETRKNDESRLITPQGKLQSTHPFPDKEAKHPAIPNSRGSNSKASASKNDERRIITIAGKNLGAHMELGSYYHHHTRKHQLHHKEGQESESGSEDCESNSIEKISNAATKSKPMFSLTNSNVQCLNNSLMFDAASVYQKPGVHITSNCNHQPKNTSSSIKGAHPPPH